MEDLWPPVEKSRPSVIYVFTGVQTGVSYTTESLGNCGDASLAGTRDAHKRTRGHSDRFSIQGFEGQNGKSDRWRSKVSLLRVPVGLSICWLLSTRLDFFFSSCILAFCVFDFSAFLAYIRILLSFERALWILINMKHAMLTMKKVPVKLRATWNLKSR